MRAEAIYIDRGETTHPRFVLVGLCEGDSVEQRAKQLASESQEWGSDFDPGRMTWQGCRIASEREAIEWMASDSVDRGSIWAYAREQARNVVWERGWGK